MYENINKPIEYKIEALRIAICRADNHSNGDIETESRIDDMQAELLQLEDRRDTEETARQTKPRPKPAAILWPPF